ncbi:MAG TPA: hypothetical protein VI789_09440 [Dehalococcoidia bacterium]|nr:hypothetical protein [Dehalococcoidia bacterium]
MPRGKKRSMLEERSWLRDYEEGKGMEEIAKAARRAPSTVSKGIEAARQERQEQTVWEGLLREAYQRHFDDMLQAAKQLRAAAQKNEREALLTGWDRHTDMLLDALRSHMADAPLWRACKRWEDRAREIRDIRETLRQGVASGVDSLSSQTPDVVDGLGWRDSLLFAADTVSSALSRSTDADGDEEARAETLRALAAKQLEHMHYHDEGWGSYGLYPRQCGEATRERMRKEHSQLVDEITTGEIIVRWSGALRLQREAFEQIDEEVEVLLLRRLLPGRCRLCPTRAY